MEEEEFEDTVECWECGEAIADPGEAYWFSPEGALCLECAARRGGEYDELADRWTREPDTTDLADERRPHV